MKKVELSSDRSNSGKQSSAGNGSSGPGWPRKEKVVLSIKARHRLMSKSTSFKVRVTIDMFSAAGMFYCLLTNHRVV